LRRAAAAVAVRWRRERRRLAASCGQVGTAGRGGEACARGRRQKVEDGLAGQRGLAEERRAGGRVEGRGAGGVGGGAVRLLRRCCCRAGAGALPAVGHLGRRVFGGGGEVERRTGEEEAVEREAAVVGLAEARGELLLGEEDWFGRHE